MPWTIPTTLASGAVISKSYVDMVTTDIQYLSERALASTVGVITSSTSLTQFNWVQIQNFPALNFTPLSGTRALISYHLRINTPTGSGSSAIGIAPYVGGTRLAAETWWDVSATPAYVNVQGQGLISYSPSAWGIPLSVTLRAYSYYAHTSGIALTINVFNLAGVNTPVQFMIREI